ncbi:MAG: coiled-coil domain-containing protein [bacterium]
MKSLKILTGIVLALSIVMFPRIGISQITVSGDYGYVADMTLGEIAKVVNDAEAISDMLDRIKDIEEQVKLTEEQISLLQKQAESTQEHVESIQEQVESNQEDIADMAGAMQNTTAALEELSEYMDPNIEYRLNKMEDAILDLQEGQGPEGLPDLAVDVICPVSNSDPICMVVNNMGDTSTSIDTDIAVKFVCKDGTVVERILVNKIPAGLAVGSYTDTICLAIPAECYVTDIYVYIDQDNREPELEDFENNKGYCHFAPYSPYLP